ncbi:MAG: glycosyltransferase family 4 protein [Gammaproteobacteria bacterium]|nr:MAG: glycosyltransferase family 4 protein [Gammaproteobacteria bacterium]
MKIAMIGARGIDSDYSGVEKTVREISVRLAARRHDVHVFSEKRNADAPSRYHGVNIVRVPALGGKHTETLSRAAVATLISIRDGFDVVHFHAQGSGIFSALSRMFGQKCVVTVHGLDWKRDKWSGLAKFSLKTAERVAARFSSHLVVVGACLQDYFKLHYGRDTTYIPNGITPVQRRATTERIRALGLTPDGYVLFASRLVPEKGCDELIRAYNGIRTDKKLVIAGGGRYADLYSQSLKAIADPAKVVFTGHARGELLEELFSHTRLFVLPSHIEGLSNALLEALGYQKPVLVSDIPENLVVVNGCGYCFRVGDVEDLRARLTTLLSDDDIVRESEMRMRGFLADAYDWDRIVDQYEQVYSSLLPAGAGHLA